MKLQDNFALNGILRIDLVYPDKVVNHLTEENLIVLNARQMMISMLYLSGRVSDPITQLKVGIGGSIDPLAEFPRAVTKDLSSLFSPILTINTSYAVDNTVPQVTFIADIPESGAVGQLISEAGLFTSSGSMFNIKTFPGIPKTSEFSIHLEWTIDIG